MEPRIDEELEIMCPGPENPSLLTQQPNHRSEDIWNGEDPGPLTCCGRSKEMANITMQDNRVLETHTFHLPHGEMLITLEDVEVILGLPIDDEVLVGPTVVEDGDWRQLCMELLGFGVPTNDNKTLVGQRIFINRLVKRIAEPLPHDATKIQIHQYARCYILVLLGDKIFMDKSGDRVHLMFLEFLWNLRDPPQYSWGNGYLVWLYRELCRASHKEASQIGGALQLVQYWAWARLPFLCPRIEPPPECDYGPWPKAPLAFKWVQIIWQPYEANLGHLPAFCVAGKDTWTARVPLIESHLALLEMLPMGNHFDPVGSLHNDCDLGTVNACE
ncbi:serine/threonine-protein phosphatase 7 long form homolog [Quercus lobata]|uniref:serine/threonine-protein phosphatase 7 long form homolog n=1 Tax=Quercus lobata TaxID=97700 RepID=UPI0012443B10|nr:serine/threonine-protein phosphatase 7 long form homolog [Quercus lobata]